MTDSPRPIAYVKRTCPFCLRLRVFLTEAGLGDTVDYVTFNDGDATHRSLRAKMEDAGRRPGFPAVDFGDGRLETGTEDLITRFADQHQVDRSALPLLGYYENGVFERYGEMFREIKALKEPT